MTLTESSTFKNFVLSDSRNAETAHFVHALWSDLRKEVGERFLKRISRKIEEKMPEGVVCEYKFGRRYHNWIAAYSDNWKRYKNPTTVAKLQQTSIRLQTDENGLNDWYITVQSPLLRKHMEGDDSSRRENLDGEIPNKLKHGNSSDWHIWWKYVEEYRDWEPSLFPKIYRELELEGDGGEITDYFVDNFVKIATDAIPIINRIEGGES